MLYPKKEKSPIRQSNMKSVSSSTAALNMQQIALSVNVVNIRTLCIRSVLSNAIFASIRRKTLQKQGL